jgi:hypothetical protein
MQGAEVKGMHINIRSQVKHSLTSFRISVMGDTQCVVAVKATDMHVCGPKMRTIALGAYR